jgi:isoamylase/glycogen operon protein
METLPFKITSGHPQPYGSSPLEDGTNFSIVSKHAKSMTLCFFSSPESLQPIYEVNLSPKCNKTGDVWHVFIHQLPTNLLYAYRIDTSEKFLLDPYAKEVLTTNQWGKAGELNRYFPLAAINQNSVFDWESDRPPLIPLEKLIVYEMHTRGFTRDPNSKTAHPGTFLGIIEKIPHLLDLGINAIELLPVFEFNESEYNLVSTITKQQLYNYWGYSTVNFFAPMQRYAFSETPGAVIQEFKMMVRALHRHGIEVILDVVYNHTAEGNRVGPTLSFRGFDEKTYYMMDSKGNYLDYSGCGNTFNCNQTVTRELILDSLRYWVTEMHVDGFRFDLAPILGRGTTGSPLQNPPLLEAISNDPILAKVKLIAEPWDAVGLYEVGSFYPQGKQWSEWNGRYRDIVRRFIKGTEKKGAFVTNICGSQDLYYQHSPCRSVNFVTAHDGFSLADLTSYNYKHNLPNGENNRDGMNNNDSWNCGIEGATTNVNILNLRLRQMRNFHLALMTSRGIPMILMGDEYGHTREGNNNTWCQDNELNWFLWDELEKQADFYRFYQKLIQFRKQHPLLQQNKFFTDKEVDWHGAVPFQPNWGKDNHFIAFTLKDLITGRDLYIAFNADQNSTIIQFPKSRNGNQWHWVVNTANPSPLDFQENVTTSGVLTSSYVMVPYSSIMLVC